MPQAYPLEIRFWEKVAISGLDDCWEWTGGIASNGYGSIKEGRPSRKMRSAHRVSYELVRGALPRGAVVRHKCDNKKCVNPIHLQIGTQKQNIHDALKRKRFIGGKVHRCLTEEQAEKIRLLLAQKSATHQEIAERFGVQRQVVTQIARGKTYAVKGA